jgi:hypothetical protein
MSERERLLSEADAADQRAELYFRSGAIQRALTFALEAKRLRKMAADSRYAPTPTASPSAAESSPPASARNATEGRDPIYLKTED